MLEVGLGLGQCWNWPKRTGGSDVEMFEILPRDWNFKPIFTQKWASVHMNCGSSTPLLNSPSSPTIPTLLQMRILQLRIKILVPSIQGRHLRQ